jgi:hypothetical protein
VPTTAYKFAGTGANDATTGAVAWSSPDNVTASDDARATSALSAGSTTTQTLRATNFGFTTSDIPTGAVINGIEVEIERQKGSGGANTATDLLVRLRTSSGLVGNDKATATAWPAADAAATYGGAADMWGSSLTDSDLRSSGFGVDIRAQRTGGSPTVAVDAVRVRVTFTNFQSGAGASAGGTAAAAVGVKVLGAAGATTGGTALAGVGEDASNRVVVSYAALSGEAAASNEGAAATAGAAAVVGVGAAIFAGAAASAGASALAATGAATFEAVGAAAGGTALAATGAASTEGAGSAAGASALAGAGAATGDGVGAAAGGASVTAVGAATAEAVGSVAGGTTVDGVADSTDNRVVISYAALSGELAVTVVSGVGRSYPGGTLTDPDTGEGLTDENGNLLRDETSGDARAVGSFIGVFSAVGTASGSAAVVAAGGSTFAGVGAVVGSTAVAAEGASTAAAAGATVGATEAAAMGGATFAGVGATAGSSGLSGVASATWAAAG